MHNIDKDSTLVALRQAVETIAGRKMQTPKDFDILSKRIFEQQHQMISSTTLKRIWGYLHDTASSPRTSTLDILAQYVGYNTFAEFASSRLEKQNHEMGTPTPIVSKPESQHPERHTHKTVMVVIALALLILVPATYFFSRQTATELGRILRQGQTFTCYDDYLQLFGLKSDEYNSYYYRHPDYPFLVLWAPQYHHPTWHNDGNPDSLMPTISEWYWPESYPTDPASMASLVQTNRERFAQAVADNEVRLVFMKGLPDADTLYTYLGIYRLSVNLSDSTRIVWRRINTNVDLDHLEALSRSRN